MTSNVEKNLEQLTKLITKTHLDLCSRIDELTKIVTQLQTGVTPVIKPLKYGCHCDIESMDPGFVPDECVFDYGDIDDCVYARQLQKQNKGRDDCEYWKPIIIHPKDILS